MVAATPGGRSLELYVRSLTSGDDPARAHARRVRDLASSRHYDDAAITVWGSEIGLSTTAFRTPEGKTILDRIGEFRAWADGRDRTMLPFFETRAVRAPVTGETHTALRLPVSCLAEYADGELVHVAPSHDGQAAHTVEDRLARLEARIADDRPPERDRSLEGDRASDSERARTVTH